MTKRTRIGIVVVMFAQGLTGCDGPHSQVTVTAPTVPSTTAPTPSSTSAANVTLSGVVTDETSDVHVPLEGVRVANADGGGFTVTDANGFYSLKPVWVCPCSFDPSVAAGTTLLWVSKPGYLDPSGQPRSVFTAFNYVTQGSRDVAIDGDTRFDIHLVRQ